MPIRRERVPADLNIGGVMADLNDISGIAALSICESLLLALNEHHLLTEGRIACILHKADAAQSGATGMDSAASPHIQHLVDTWPLKSPIVRGPMPPRPDAGAPVAAQN